MTSVVSHLISLFFFVQLQNVNNRKQVSEDNRSKSCYCLPGKESGTICCNIVFRFYGVFIFLLFPEFNYDLKCGDDHGNVAERQESFVIHDFALEIYYS